MLKAEVAQAVAADARAKAVLRQAELNLSYTTISAPIDGVVGNRTLRVGRTLAYLDGADAVHRLHIAEALSYRRPEPRTALAA